MKKTISINISGVIFHIEEDGYDKLKSYLTSVQQYFSSYEDSQEIITDIENRIAEKLFAKLKANEKLTGSPREAVTLEDVNELIAAMGTVADFEAVEEEELFTTSARSNQSNPAGGSASTAGGAYGYGSATGSTQSGRTNTGPRRLLRDLHRKTLGGVASGLANYFNVDPVWVRLVFVLLVLGFPALGSSSNNEDFFGSLAGVTVLAYIAMWIAFPGSSTLEDDKTVKKFYRDPDDKVLGGVAAGLSAYFGIDRGLVRLLFVVSIALFGIGLISYLVLWAISPTADTVTEKMEMQGQPITLANIEQTIKHNLNVPESGPESGLTKVLLFPFRAVSMILSGLGQALGPFLNGIVSVIRVLAGIILILVAFSGVIACVSLAGAAFGIISGVYPDNAGPFPFDWIRADLDAPMVITTFIAGVLPCVALGVLGVMLITRRFYFNGRTALTLLGIWILSMVIAGATITPLVSGFSRSETIEETVTLPVASIPTPTFAMSDTDTEFDYNPSIEIRGYAGNEVQLLQRFKARGRNRQDAENNARTIKYNYTVKDSTIRFNRELELAPKARFRAQELDMDLLIPFEKPFRMTRDFAYFIRNRFTQTELDRMDRTIWKLTANEGLVSINFPRDIEQESDENNDQANSDDDDFTDEDFNASFDAAGPRTRTFNVRGFDEIEATGALVVRVQQGETFQVVADGEQRELDKLDVEVDGQTLKLSPSKGSLFGNRSKAPVRVSVTMPTVEGLSLTGACQGKLDGFGRLNRLDLDLTGASLAVIDANVGRLSVEMTGASKAQLKGNADELKSSLTGASLLAAKQMSINKAEVSAHGASKAAFGQVNNLDESTSGASSISRGN
ncbi:PspC domain-containing protein [Rudanella paleaurantiibacter]|uniref:PspC domain-containing protein n=1 Tax=Rudanella paleaurantiibacter TaxID=2614655 RepID=A0A7J5TYR1_9BACT|nr:PspC domain-containing protein [Rudanella paleaurantiibacter]KAB7730289.1 PspC domain-containing protein [Rudanella paleaurantiibacter]